MISVPAVMRTASRGDIHVWVEPVPSINRPPTIAAPSPTAPSAPIAGRSMLRAPAKRTSGSAPTMAIGTLTGKASR